MDELRIIPVTPDDDILWRRYWATWNAAAAELGPSAAQADPDERRRALDDGAHIHHAWFLAMVGEQPAGASATRVMLDSDPCSGYLDIGVLQEYRRHGAGRALADATLASARGAGARRIDCWVPTIAGFETGDGGRTLAPALGMKINTVDVVREAALPLDLPVAPPVADGYRLEVLTDAPGPEMYDDLRLLLAAMDTDVPQGDLGVAHRAWPDENLRARFDADGDRAWRVFARDQEGHIAGYTEVFNDPHEGMRHRLQQGDTVVLQDHRGHGLGMALKRAAHDRACADAPWMTTGQTTNDASNAHMIKINEELGYREVARLENWTWLA